MSATLNEEEEMGNASEFSLLVGSGRNLEELRAVLGALAGLHGGAAPRILEDLAELLDPVEPLAPAGRILLECGEVPAEDIGFLRRFLERSGTWDLVLVGEDARDPRARRLLTFPGARWLQWPPDLEQVKGLFRARSREGGADPGAGSTDRSPGPEAELVPRSAPAAPAPPASRSQGTKGAKGTEADAQPELTEVPVDATPPSGDEALDLGAVLEELLAGRAVGGDETPRYLFRAESVLPVLAPRDELEAAFEGLLTMAEACSGPGQAIGVRAEEDGDGIALVAIDFPPGPLTDGDIPALLDGAFSGDPALEEGVARMREAAALLNEHAGEVQVTTGRPGRLSLESRLPTAPAPA